MKKRKLTAAIILSLGASVVIGSLLQGQQELAAWFSPWARFMSI